MDNNRYYILHKVRNFVGERRDVIFFHFFLENMEFCLLPFGLGQDGYHFLKLVLTDSCYQTDEIVILTLEYKYPNKNTFTNEEIFLHLDSRYLLSHMYRAFACHNSCH